ncbi:MAG: hypothetical protein CMG52_03635 [Candidatus Marinimicrobia bacterium]|nr:hypothetical protein [Candidatus Neomarinimicrobiota bacterium]
MPIGTSRFYRIYFGNNGDQYGGSCPVMDSFVKIGNIVMGVDKNEGRGPKDFGIENLSISEFQNYLQAGT